MTEDTIILAVAKYAMAIGAEALSADANTLSSSPHRVIYTDELSLMDLHCRMVLEGDLRCVLLNYAGRLVMEVESMDVPAGSVVVWPPGADPVDIATVLTMMGITVVSYPGKGTEA